MGRPSYRTIKKWLSPKEVMILLLIAHMSIGVVTTETYCKLNMRKCTGSDECKDYKLWCDGTEHCENGADEANCGRKCPKGTEPCKGSYQCLNFRLFCDGFKDCENGADESYCDKVKSCGGYCCADPAIRGISVGSALLCDGPKDCDDGSDEWFCDEDITCPSGSIMCPGNKQCLPIKRICKECTVKAIEVDYCKKAATKFRAYNKYLSYADAAEACEDEGSRLAQPMNWEDYMGILTAKIETKETYDVWIGINRTGDIQWSYEDGTKLGAWNAWLPGKPSNMANCVLQEWYYQNRIDGWNDVDCHQENHYVCEFGAGSDGDNLQASPMMMVAAISTCLLLNA